MSVEIVTTAVAAVVRDLPRAPNRNNLTLRELADAYMAAFSGRDSKRVYSVGFWVKELGDTRLSEIDADAIADVLDRYACAPQIFEAHPRSCMKRFST